MATPPATAPVLPWSLDHVLDALGKLPEIDLQRFLSRAGYTTQDLDGLTRPFLLEVAFSLLDVWRAEAKSPTEFLIAATANLCRASFEAFVRLFWDEVPGAQPLLWNWHMGVYTSELQLVAEDIIVGKPRPHDLICNVSPGASKSTIWSILFPCWVWTRMPGARIITASHTDSLVTDLAAKARDVMKGVMYRLLFPDIEFTEVQDSKGHYRNVAGGERFTCTVGGKSPMGLHAHFVIIDDPTDPKKVLSEAERKTAADFLTKVIPSRRVRGARGDVCVTMLVMQRLALGDPTDVMLEVAGHEGAAPLRHLCIPAEITEDVSPPELRKYYEGINEDAAQDANGLMDPIRLNRQVLREQRAVLGEWSYAGQYLQKPRPPGGGMFKISHFSRRCRAAPYNCRRIRYWDRAASQTESACATAGTLMAYDGDKIYVEDVVHGRWEPDERNAMMRATAMRDRTRYGKYEPVIYVEAEGGSAGRDAWLGVVRALIGFHVKEDIVRGSKDTRAEPWSTQLSAGNVWIVDNGESEGIGRAGWDINGYVEEHIHFRPMPGKRLGRYKDRVDSSSGAFNLLVGLKRMHPPLRTYGLMGRKGIDGRRLVVCSQDDLPALELDSQATLLVFLSDPVAQPTIIEQEAGAGGPPPGGNVAGGETHLLPAPASQESEEGVVGFNGSLPEARTGGMPASIHETGRGQLPSLLKTLGHLDLRCADLDPADYQDKWDQPVEPWGKKPEEVQYNRDLAKQLWAFALKKYDKPWQVLVLVDQGGEDGRALSVAQAIADVLRLPRSAIYLPGDNGEVMPDEAPPNEYIYQMTKMGRNLVAG